MKIDNSTNLSHFRFIWRKTVFILLCLFLITVISAISLTIGSYPLSAANVFDIIANNIFKNNYVGSTEEIVVWTLRLPRIAMAILSGIGLGVSGAAMQAILRNPLASPTTIGVSAAAGLGAALAILAGVGVTWGKSILIGNAFFFAMIPASGLFGASLLLFADGLARTIMGARDS